MKKYKILVACEESQSVTKEFRKLGFEAYSCDLLPTSGENPEYHIQSDVLKLLDTVDFDRQFETQSGSIEILPKEGWDLIIAFPPCTDLAISGARWFPQKIADGRQQRSIEFFMKFANYDKCPIVIENPVGIMSTKYKKPTQIIQPWMFGDIASKTTCLWIKGLPNLIPDTTTKPEMEYWVNPDGTKRMEKWMYDVRCKDAKSGLRAKLASKTFPGIAKALATQYGEYLLNK